MKILMVLTSHDQLGNTGRPTGFWLEEFAAPYFVFRDAGVELTLASPKGGQPPLDPKSDLPENQTPAMARFKKDAAAQKALATTVKLADVQAEDFDSSSGGLLQFRQAIRTGVPFARGASPRYLPGRSAGERKTRYRFHERRGRGDAAHQGCAVPGRRRTATARRHIREEGELAAFFYH